MRVLITGASGLVGEALSQALRERGDAVVAAVRRPSDGDSLRWDPQRGFADGPEALAGFDAVVHLAGESIAGRWTAAKKQRIRDSRVDGTRTVVRAIAEAGARLRPRALINASAVGVYGNRLDEVLDEDSPAGGNFLAAVTQEWEAEAQAVTSIHDPERDEAPVRLCLARFGVILAARGGALAEMLTPFRLGLGGRVGNGRQWMAWIHLADVVRALLFMLDDAGASGPYNVVAPAAVRNLEFTRSLGEALHRPTLLPVPRLAVRLALGEMGQALLLDGQRAVPRRLLDAGFEFRFESLGVALADLLGR